MSFNFFGREVLLRKETAAVAIFFLVVAVGSIGYAISNNSSKVIIEKSIEHKYEEKNETQKQAAAVKPLGSDPEEPEVSNNEIKIYVVGCVNNRGIVTLKKGQLVDDAIKAAGGATEEADLENINLVYRLKDNVMLKVKSKNKQAAVFVEGQSSGNSGHAGAGTGAEIVSGSGGSVITDEGGEGDTKGKININTASENELDTLPGIGKEAARDIISYRKKYGGFKKITDIMRIPGIKESRFEKIKDLISVE